MTNSSSVANVGQCSPENLEFCGEPTFEFTSPSKICEEGSITIILAVIALSVCFITTHLLYTALCRFNKLHDKPGLTSQGRDWTFANLLERLLVKPFIPTSLENFIATTFFWWLLLTLPMGITRFYDKKWEANAFTQHSMFNLMSRWLGCGTINIRGITYTNTLEGLLPKKSRLIKSFIKFLRKKKREEDEMDMLHSTAEKEQFKQIDYLFTIHLTLGLLWLSVGFFQIFSAKTGWSTNATVRKNAHKWFGRVVALPSLFLHLFFAGVMALKNPVNQVFPIQFLYIGDILDMVIVAMSGVREAIKMGKAERAGASQEVVQEHKNRHKHDMVYVYIRSIMGSGAIRASIWLLWMAGKFFPFETRIRIDRGACQTHADMLGSDFIGIAEQCWESVFLNLALMKILLIWQYWLFLCVQKQRGELPFEDESAAKVQFTNAVITLGLYAIALYYDWFPQQVIIVWTMGVKMSILHKTIAGFLRPPPAGQADGLVGKAAKAVYGEYRHPDDPQDHEHQD